MLATLLEKHYDHRILSIEGPTGCGKTRAIVSLLSSDVEHRSPLGERILVVQPTAYAVSRVQQMMTRMGGYGRIVSVINARVAWRRLLDGDTVDTIIIDEAHFHSLDYEALLRLLSFLTASSSLRVYLFSATVNRSRFLRLFPTIHFTTSDFHSQYSLSIEYREWLFNKCPVNQLDLRMRDHITILLSKSYPLLYRRIIVFLASHQQCEHYKSYAENVYKIEHCLLYHGPILPMLLNPSNSFILFTTNIVESAITIPDVSLIIDLGVYYQKMANGIVSLHWCDKTMLDQRAGRTGRTCSGLVVRAFPRSLLKDLSDRVDMEHCWDPIIIDLIARDMNPYQVLGIDTIASSMNRLINYGLIGNSSIITFARRSKLDPECAIMMHRLLHKKFHWLNPPGGLLILLTIVLLDLMRTQNMIFFDFRVKRGVVFETDEVCILLSFFLSLYAPNSSSSVDRLSKIYPLQLKGFNLWKQRYSCFLQEFPETSVFTDLSNVKNIFHCRFRQDKKVVLYDLGSYREILSQFFFHQTSLEITQSHGGPMVMTRDTLDTRMFSRFNPSLLYNRPFLVLHWKRMNQLGSPLVSLFLYPHHHRFTMTCHLPESLCAYKNLQAIKCLIQKKKNKFLYEIQELVAYYPYNHGMMATISEWKKEISAYNHEKIRTHKCTYEF